LYGEDALAAQSMWYWKPPGARGQALHQDDFYLRTRPGECMAAWLAVDAADAENGALRVVPATHVTPLQCPHEADAGVSFSAHEVDLADAWVTVQVPMGAGDVLYFPGRLIHGSLPNRSAQRWRRSFICHYLPARAAEVARGYQPLLAADGREVRLADPGRESDPCGGPEFPRPAADRR
jgi:ectoine hydroxylase-related dioxygenase (phytanoyl-CoA dioxygenase family)